MGEVGFAKQDENCFNTSSHHLLKVSLVGNDERDVVINLDPMRGGPWCAIGA